MAKGLSGYLGQVGGTPGVGVLGSLYIKKEVGLFLGPNLDHCETTNYDSRLTTTVNKTM